MPLLKKAVMISDGAPPELYEPGAVPSAQERRIEADRMKLGGPRNRGRRPMTVDLPKWGSAHQLFQHRLKVLAPCRQRDDVS